MIEKRIRKRKKVLIITYYWPPAGGSGVQRWLFFVKYFRRYGIEPVVYTAGGAAYPVIDEKLEKHVPPGITVLRGRIWEPGNFIRKAQEQGAGMLPGNPGMWQRFLTYVRANYFVPDARKFWIKPSVRFLKEYLKEHPVDMIVSTGPPHSTHVIARNLKRKTGIRWLADFRDPWTDIDYFHKLPLTPVNYARHRKLESTVLSEANVVTVVSEEMRKKYLPYNKNCHVITNGFDGEVVPPEPYTGKYFVMTHSGTLNADRNHEIFWEALRELIDEVPGFGKHLRLKMIGNTAPEVKRSIRRHELTGYVEITDYLPYDEMEKVLSGSAVLLLFVNRVPGAKGILTGKIFEYLRSGKPVLAIAPQGGDLERIIKQTNCGILVDFEDKRQLKKGILEYYHAFTGGKLIAATAGVERYARENLTHIMSKLLQ